VGTHAGGHEGTAGGRPGQPERVDATHVVGARLHNEHVHCAKRWRDNPSTSTRATHEIASLGSGAPPQYANEASQLWFPHAKVLDASNLDV